jgi:uncharacterized membrane protein
LNYIVNIILSLLCCILMIFFIFFGRKVYQIVKLNDKMMLLMIFFLTLDLACKYLFLYFTIYPNTAKLAFFIMNVFEFRPRPNTDNSDEGGFKQSIINIMIVLPVGFFSLAVVINLRNWIYYYIKIGEMAFLNGDSEKF